jgi:hypothetical protein
MRAADHAGPGRKEAYYDRRGSLGWQMGGKPIGMAKACTVTGDIKNVLDGKRQPTERPIPRTWKRHVIVSAKGI